MRSLTFRTKSEQCSSLVPLKSCFKLSNRVRNSDRVIDQRVRARMLHAREGASWSFGLLLGIDYNQSRDFRAGNAIVAEVGRDGSARSVE